MSAQMDAALARLDEVLNAPVVRRAPSREYLELKAATVAADVDQGTFTAVISTQDVDREPSCARQRLPITRRGNLPNNPRCYPAAGSKAPLFDGVLMLPLGLKRRTARRTIIW